MALDQMQALPDRQGEAAEAGRMSFGDHLEELRQRIIYALVGIVLTSVVTLFFGRDIVGWLVQPLARTLRSMNHPPHTNFLNPVEPFGVYLKVSIIGGLILASPWVVYQLWKFVSSGLYRHERRVVLTLLPFSSGMSALAVVFMYWVMLPVCLVFFIGFAASYPPPQVDVNERGGGLVGIVSDWARSFSGMPGGKEAADPDAGATAGATDGTASGSGEATEPPVQTVEIRRSDPLEPVEGQIWLKRPEMELRTFVDGRTLSYASLTGGSLVQPQIKLGDYISMVTFLTLGLVLAFQLPVVLLVLGWTGLVDPAVLARYRKYGVFGCFVLGAVFTPADPISMFVLALPLWGLFELGLLLMRWGYKPADLDAENA
ncbi:MAG: twin-arginine translocase subunit TatC [Phycisphaeraceae bacterium]